jgi:L-2-hydroxyglutarate oxidase LhgO
MERVDVLVVGGGIVGLATARVVLRAHPDRSVVVVEKETSVAACDGPVVLPPLTKRIR